MLVAFNKPYGVLSQFTPEPGSRWRTLAEFGLPKAVYAAGRLDADSEGLLLLTDEPAVAAAILERHAREYWVQVEGEPAEEALRRLADGVVLGDYRTRRARAWRLAGRPDLPPREPPIRVRQSIPDTWIALELHEGRNRQVRRMTAAVGHPTLRLVRARIGDLRLADLRLRPGQWAEVPGPPAAARP
ncbi:MAG TPA: pseudouridine synthase [Opitutaceae bacterium]|nr:pseudouridine synthase [Opitutaceae bacterium]